VTEKFTMTDLMWFLSDQALDRERMHNAFGRNGMEQRDVRMFLTAANIVDGCRQDPQAAARIKAIIQRGSTLTRDTDESSNRPPPDDEKITSETGDRK